MMRLLAVYLLATVAALAQFGESADRVYTTLGVQLDATDTQITLVDGSAFPDAAYWVSICPVGECRLGVTAANGETVYVTGKASTHVLTIAATGRQVQADGSGTSTGSVGNPTHAVGEYVVLTIVAAQWNAVVSELGRFGNVLQASQFAGADCGAKINAALTAGGSTARVQVDQSCGTTISTAVTATARQVVEFVECGVWTVSAIITGGHVQGAGNGSPWGPTRGDGCVELFQANTSNLAQIVLLNTNAASIRDIEIDANTTNNTTSVGIMVTAAAVEIRNVHVQEAPSHGIAVISTTTSNNSAQGVQIQNTRSFNNDGDGLFVQDAQDPFVNMSGFEGNGGHGIYLENSGGASITGRTDMAGNSGACLMVTGTTGGLEAGLNGIIGNQCGNMIGDGFVIDGHDGTGRVSDKNILADNTFWANAAMTANTYDAIRLEGSTDNVVMGNIIQSHSEATFRYGINATDTGNSGSDVWALNRFSSTFGTGTINPVPALTASLQNEGSSSTIDGNLAIRGDSMFIECEADVANCFMLQGSPDIAYLGLTWDLAAIVESGVVADFLVHTGGHIAARTDSYAGGDFKWGSNTAFVASMEHANSAARAYTFPDAAGEVSLLGQAVSPSEMTAPARAETQSWNLEAPTTGDTGLWHKYFAAACTMQRAWCSTDAGTVTINLDERAEATPNTTGTSVLTSNLVCDATSEASTVFSNAGIAQDVPIALLITAVSGATNLRVGARCQLD